ncbi:unnamed protein product [Vitrella brassicaformis CCMP3155]|uniref:Uncharacterized protein n=1 Tax=Vitrella brassicaformis (strain CCMP3155) TaxID=1169540 RepID=A0A0G4F4N7_VITBC|nr:unnamed protein product [Vitrella brassicaformis CCMP3155]|eukprot:CEM06781.1 unnamed protein product [Vitrella brassicaformis CCMP3155]
MGAAEGRLVADGESIEAKRDHVEGVLLSVKERLQLSPYFVDQALLHIKTFRSRGMLDKFEKLLMDMVGDDNAPAELSEDERLARVHRFWSKACFRCAQITKGVSPAAGGASDEGEEISTFERRKEELQRSVVSVLDELDLPRASDIVFSQVEDSIDSMEAIDRTEGALAALRERAAEDGSEMNRAVALTLFLAAVAGRDV